MYARRYLVHDFEGGSLLRIEPVRKKRESGPYECVAENGVGDEVSVQANLEIYDGECLPHPPSVPVFIDVLGAQESILRNRFPQPPELEFLKSIWGLGTGEE